MRRYLPWALVLLALIAVFLAIRADRAAQRRLGGALATVARLRADSVLWAGESKRVDSVYVRDSVIYTRARTEYRRVVDSIQVHDTVTVREQVIISAADTALARADSALRSANARAEARDSLLAVVGEQRQADRKLADARLRAASPRLLPYLEAGVDPLHQWAATGRAGLELRAFGPVRLTGALIYSTHHTTTTSAAVGVRLTF